MLKKLIELNMLILGRTVAQYIAEQIDAVIDIWFVPNETGHRIQIRISTPGIGMLIDIPLSKHVDVEEVKGNLPRSVPLGFYELGSMAVDYLDCVWIIDAVIFWTETHNIS